VGVDNLVVLACVLRATTIKTSSTFSGRKVHPKENPGYAYAKKMVASENKYIKTKKKYKMNKSESMQ